MDPLVKQRRNKDISMNSRHLTQTFKPASLHLPKTSIPLPKEFVKNSNDKSPGSYPIKKYRFPREVFTAGEASTMPSSIEKKSRRLVTLKAQVEEKPAETEKASLTPVTSFKLVPKLKANLTLKLPKDPAVRDQSLHSAMPRLIKKLSKGDDESSCHGSHLPIISSNKTSMEKCYTNITSTPKWKPATPRKDVLGGTLKFVSIGDILPQPPKKEHIRHNSNQIANLELVSQYAFLPKPPTKEIPVNKRPIKMVRLKPIPRDVSSSHGDTNGKVKILMPKDFVGSKTRPSSKDDPIIPKPPNTTNKVYSPFTDLKAKRRRVVLNKNGLNLLSNKVEWKKPAQASDNTPNMGFEELCNVTFGDSGFRNVKVQLTPAPTGAVAPNILTPKVVFKGNCC